MHCTWKLWSRWGLVFSFKLYVSDLIADEPQPTNNQRNSDPFSEFVSGPSAPTADTNSTASADLSSLVEEKQESKSTKESILALYGPSSNQQPYGMGGMWWLMLLKFEVSSRLIGSCAVGIGHVILDSSCSSHVKTLLALITKKTLFQFWTEVVRPMW